MHLGVVVVLNLMIGLLTPPVGMSLYMVSNIGRIPLERVMAGAVPFIVSLIVALAIVTLRPGVFDLAAQPGHEMTQTKRSLSMSMFFGEIRQLGYVVPDIEAAMDYWSRVLGVGPCFYNRARADR